MSGTVGIREILGSWLPGTDLVPFLEAFGYDYWTLRTYALGVYGMDGVRLLDPSSNQSRIKHVLEAPDALAVPVYTGLDPKDPQTAEWARFLGRRWDMAPGSLRLERCGRFANPADAYRRIQEAGVAFDYLCALDCGPTPTPLYPLDDVISLWKSGVPLEYARSAIYGVAP